MDSKTLLEKLVKLQNISLELKTVSKEIELGSYINDDDKGQMESLQANYIAERDAVLHEIQTQYNDKQLLPRIEKLQQRYRGIFIARVVNAVCRGCRMAVPATIMVHLLSVDRLVYCENCGRILRKVEPDNIIVKQVVPPPAPKRGRKPKQPPKF